MKMISIIHIFALVFALFAISRVVLRARDKQISVNELFFWLAIWLGLVFVVFFPQIISKIALFLGIGRGIDVVVYASIAVLFYLIFRLYVKLEDNQKTITLLVRELALKKKRKK